MKKIRIAAFSLIICIVSVLTGCGGSENGEAEVTRGVVTEAVQERTEATSENSETEAQTEQETEEITEIVTEDEQIFSDDSAYVEYHFRSTKQLNQHFEKHGSEFDGDFDYETAEQYEKGASDVINNSDALYKTEAEDGDGVYYIEETNEFVILSTDGYIRTYFRPSAGINYFNRQ